jgi:hypothetical protein
VTLPHKPHASLTLDQPTLSQPIDTSNGVPYTWGSGRAEGIRAAASAGADADPTPLDPTDGTISQELAKGSTRPLLEDLKQICYGADPAHARRRGSGGSAEIVQTACGSQGRAQEGNASPTPQQGRAGGLEAALDLRARAALGTWR